MSDNPFADCRSIDEILALVLDVEGPEALRELLSMAVSAGVVCRQDLEEAAEALADAGLPQAVIVLEATEQAPVAKFWKSRQQHLTKIEAARRYWSGADRG